MKLILIILIGTLLCPVVTNAETKTKESIVVMPFLGTRLNPAALAALDDLLVFTVDSIGIYNVVSKSDLEAQIGREQLKDLMGCGSISCAAEIGGALDTRFLLSASARQLGEKLVLSLSLIDTQAQKTYRGQSRMVDNENYYEGAVNKAVGMVFLKLGVLSPGQLQALQVQVKAPSVPKQIVTAPSPTPQPTAITFPPYNPTYGEQARSYGLGMTLVGLGMTLGGLAYALAYGVTPAEDGETVTWPDGDTSTLSGDICEHSWAPQSGPASECDKADYAAIGIGVGTYGAGILLMGLGSSTYKNGRARAFTSDPDASGHHSLTWLGWVGAGVGVLGPFISISADQRELAYLTGIGGTLLAAGVFGLTMNSSSVYATDKHRNRHKIASFVLFKDREKLMPGVKVAFSF
jgi:hypothetical protein